MKLLNTVGKVADTIGLRNITIQYFGAGQVNTLRITEAGIAIEYTAVGDEHGTVNFNLKEVAQITAIGKRPTVGRWIGLVSVLAGYRVKLNKNQVEQIQVFGRDYKERM